MSVSAFEGYMTQELNASVMECIANALVNGTGSGQGTGLLTGITWKDGKNALTFGKTTGLKYAGRSKDGCSTEKRICKRRSVGYE